MKSAWVIAVLLAAVCGGTPEVFAQPVGGDTPVPSGYAGPTKPKGHVVMRCTVTAEGQLSDCSIVSETPAGLGYGAAALKLSDQFKMRPYTRDGQSVGGATVTIPMNFVLPLDTSNAPK
jgi:TonB family protein